MTNDRLKEVTAELNRNTSSDIVGVSYGFKTSNNKTTDEKTLVFTVVRKKPLSEIPESERIPSEIVIDGETFKTDVVEATIKAHAYGFCGDQTFYDWQGQPPQNRNKHRPLMGGISVTNYTALGAYVGTLGFIAVDNETNTLVGVSNNHVLCDDAFITTERNLNGIRTNVFTPGGHQVNQPNEVGLSNPSLGVGIVKKYQPIRDIPFNNTVDAALVSLDFGEDEPIVDSSVSWIQFGITGMTSAPRFATTSEINALLENPNTRYYTSGRTTGPKGQGDTKLFCTASSSSITIGYTKQTSPSYVYMNDTFELQASGSTTPTGDWCYYPSAGGDSGSAILCEIEGEGGQMEWVIVGLLYGGKEITDPENPEETIPIATLCNRIDNIASALNISAWDGTFNGVTFANNQSPLTHVVEASSNDKTIVVNGLTYWQVGLVNNSEYPPDPTPEPTPSATVGAPPSPTPNPTATPNATPEPTPEPTPPVTATSTPSPQTFTFGYQHENSCTTSINELFINGVKQNATIQLTQGSTGSGTLRTYSVYPGDNITITHRPFNLLSPCTNSYTSPTTRLTLNGSSVGTTNSNTSNSLTYNYTVQQGVNPSFVVIMENSPAPTATPVPTYTLTLQNVTSATYAESCAKGYIIIEKNGSEVARLTKTQGNQYANWNTSSITFTQSDTVYVKSYSQGGGGAGCATEDTRVRSMVNGVIRTTSEVNTDTNGQSYLFPDSNQTVTGQFIVTGGL